MKEIFEKICCTCEQSKILEKFSKNSKAKDGLQARCKDCQKESDKLRSEINRQNNSSKELSLIDEHNEFKRCGTCREERKRIDFCDDKTKPDGKCNRCKLCQKESRERHERKIYMREYQREYSKTPQRKQAVRDYNRLESTKAKKREFNQTEEHKQYMRNYTSSYWENGPRGLLSSARNRSVRWSLPYHLEESDIVIPEFCPVFGIKLERGSQTIKDCSPSLDRIIPEFGYVPGNVAVMSNRANRIKNTGTAEQHRKIANWINSEHILVGPIQNDKQAVKGIYHNCRRHARERGLEFAIERNDIIIPEMCPVFKIPLIRGKGRLCDNSPTLDRIDSNLGYVIDNIAVISYIANRVKNNGTAEEHLKIADWMDRMLKCSEVGTNYPEPEPEEDFK